MKTLLELGGLPAHEAWQVNSTTLFCRIRSQQDGIVIAAFEVTHQLTASILAKQNQGPRWLCFDQPILWILARAGILQINCKLLRLIAAENLIEQALKNVASVAQTPLSFQRINPFEPLFW